MAGLGIVLRTVCGCERVLVIDRNVYPAEWRVPFTRQPAYALAVDEDFPCTQDFSVRTFVYTPFHGTYGYPIYLERLDARQTK